MTKRDPQRTARNREDREITARLLVLLPAVLQATGYSNQQSLNATIGSKTDEFIDLKHEVINSPEEYTGLWLNAIKIEAEQDRLYPNAIDELWAKLKASRVFQKYLMLFLRRSYLRHYDALSKARPFTDDAEMWIGQNNADWGLLVTPRFINGQWENDKSEIRHFRPRYWSIGHVLRTGLVVPGRNRKQAFPDVESYLTFFQDVLVRPNGSVHGDNVAERYCNFVRQSSKPEDVPLLIPELRYAGRVAKHEYRLDFCTIDVDSDTRVGFELSPWSSHGTLKGTAGKSQKEINSEASANFSKEAKKCKSFFRTKGIAVLIYTDDDLSDPDSLFRDIKRYLTPKAAPRQLAFANLREFFR